MSMPPGLAAAFRHSLACVSPRVAAGSGCRTAVRCAQTQAAAHEFQVEGPEAGDKVRLDAFLAGKLQQASRARLQASIKEGLVEVNGRRQLKASYQVRPGDLVSCSVLPPPPLEAAPEALPLDIVFEDEHLIVINKAADMVVHPSPGHYSGTLVNALLYHCRLPAMRASGVAEPPLSLQGAAAAAAATSAAAAAAAASEGSSGGGGAAAVGMLGLEQHQQQGAPALEEDGMLEGSSEELDGEDEEEEGGMLLLWEPTPAGSGSGSNGSGGSSSGSSGRAESGAGPVIRPGIVHRLDKGTTGLLVVAKSDAAHASLSRQFRERSMLRSYLAVAFGVPAQRQGRVVTNVGRDLRDRKRMAAFAYASARGRTAASNYSVVQLLAGGRAALVQWRLETGRTHQIRVHAQHIKHPLLGDETYGGGAAAAGSALGGGRPLRAAAAQALARRLARPALHAATLGFEHPATQEQMLFECPLPEDMLAVVEALQQSPFVPG